MQVVVEVIFAAIVDLEMLNVVGVTIKLGHIQKVCHSSAAVIQSRHFTDSAVVTVSPSLEIDDIPSMFQIL